jgi:2-keto-3-deoxy-6-phosphogluconate aldolase
MIMKENMNSDLCIGIASRKEAYEVAAMETGKTTVLMRFPATKMGREAIKSFLAGYGRSLRLAVAGGAALNLALALRSSSVGETFIVSTAVADQAVALARYAGHMA